MPRRAAVRNPEVLLRGRRGQDMVTRADAPDVAENTRGGGPEVEGKIRALEHADRKARASRHEAENVERARLRVTNFVRNTEGRRVAHQRARDERTWVEDAAAHQRRMQEEADRAHTQWLDEELRIDAAEEGLDMEEMHDHVAALYSATHPRLPGMDDTSALR